MPLFTPILRMLMLFLNVYFTFKTLKHPPATTRNGGRPSAKLVTQRKRDMKGCLAVWIVWVSPDFVGLHSTDSDPRFSAVL
jgi:receptor expression-enhancing protein 5/6